MKRESLAVAVLMCGVSALSAQNVDVTLVEKQRTTTTFPSRSTESASSHSGRRALPQPDASTPRTYTVTGVSLSLQLPDGRIVEVVCTDKMADPTSTQPRRACLTPDGGPIHAKFKGANVKLTWRIANKKHSESYSLLHLPLTAPPHR